MTWRQYLLVGSYWLAASCGTRRLRSSLRTTGQGLPTHCVKKSCSRFLRRNPREPASDWRLWRDAWRNVTEPSLGTARCAAGAGLDSKLVCPEGRRHSEDDSHCG